MGASLSKSRNFFSQTNASQKTKALAQFKSRLFINNEVSLVTFFKII